MGKAALIDVYDERSQRLAGLLLSATLNTTRPLVVGSSGVEYALLGTWRSQGLIGDRPAIDRLATADRMIVVSGSCSAVTETQIRTALGQGFTGIALDYEAIASGQGAEVAFAVALDRGRRVLNEGGSPILYTALGPGDAVPQAGDVGTGDVVGSAKRLAACSTCWLANSQSNGSWSLAGTRRAIRSANSAFARSRFVIRFRSRPARLFASAITVLPGRLPSKSY